MAHNKERVEGLRQIMHLCGDYLPGLLPLIHKELEAETKKLMSEALHERNEHILAVRFAPPKAEPTTTKGKIDAKLEHIQQHIDTTKVEVAYRGVKLCEEALKDIKLDYEKFKESTNAKLESHDKKFATVKKINQTFIELFKIVNEKTQTIFNLTNKR